MDKSRLKKIAIFRALFLGDMLSIIPAVRALKAGLPEASVTLVGLPWAESFAGRFSQYFDSFIEFPGWPGLPEQQPDSQKILHFLKRIRTEKFDLVLQMQGNGAVTNEMCQLWGARAVAGLRTTDGYCPDEKLFPISEDNEHEILRFLKLIDALEIPRQGTWLEFPLTKEDQINFLKIAQALNILPGGYVCLHPGARDERRRWSTKNFAAVGDRLAEKGLTLILTGSESEQSLLEEVASQMKHPVINTVKQIGHVSLGDLASLISHAKLLVSNDTGVSHIAAALQIPSVVIFSPFSDQRRWAPLNTILHRIVTPDKSGNQEYILECALRQLEIYNLRLQAHSPEKLMSSLLLN